MASKRTNGPHAERTRRPTAKTPEARLNQLTSLAYDVVEERLKSGEATSQETTFFLKAGSLREKLEQELIAERVKLEKAKADNLASQARSEELMAKAIEAFRSYSGQAPRDEVEEYD